MKGASEPGPTLGARAPVLAVVLFNVALLLALLSAALSLVSWAPPAQTSGPLVGMAFGVTALVLLVATCRYVPRGVRVYAFSILVMAAFGILAYVARFFPW